MKSIRLDTNEILALIGLGVLGLGVALVSVPAALIVVGGLVLAYVVIPDQAGPTS